MNLGVLMTPNVCVVDQNNSHKKEQWAQQGSKIGKHFFLAKNYSIKKVVSQKIKCDLFCGSIEIPQHIPHDTLSTVRLFNPQLSNESSNWAWMESKCAGE